MQNTQVVWEDEENNRQVVLSVKWARTADETEVCDILPEEVRFLDPERRHTIRKIGVWTQGGRRMLASQFQQSAQYAEFHSALLKGIRV